MNKLLSFLLGVILTIAVVFIFFRPNRGITESKLEGDIRGVYDKLVDLGYTEDLSENDIEVVVQTIKKVSNWVPEGTVTPGDVLEGKTFYNKSREMQTGTYIPEELNFLGDASPADVLEGRQFYSNSKELLTGTLKLQAPVSYKGNATASDVLAGKTFYSNSDTLLTGLYTPPSVSYLGDALITDVMSGRKFYSDSGTLLTGTWSFLGDASEEDVLIGKKFYSDSGTLLTGTYTPLIPIDFTNMQYSTYDDYGEGDYQGEESEWRNMTMGEDIVWKDERTGLYWSEYQGSSDNIFALASCDFFTSGPRSSYDGSDSDCGNAINYCATLDFAGRTNWYLPSQKELIQAYIDGIYNQPGVDEASSRLFATDNQYWSSSGVSFDPGSAWTVALTNCYTSYYNKSSNYYGVRCVSWDE